jgi:hypothetical protein
VFTHVYIQIVLPLCDVAALGTHEVLVVRVCEHVFGEVGLIPAPEVTDAALVRLLTFQRKPLRANIGRQQEGGCESHREPRKKGIHN